MNQEGRIAKGRISGGAGNWLGEPRKAVFPLTPGLRERTFALGFQQS